MSNEFFQDWLFHYNPYTKEWNAFKREHMNDYFNGSIQALHSKSFKTLTGYVKTCAAANSDLPV